MEIVNRRIDIIRELCAPRLQDAGPRCEPLTPTLRRPLRQVGHAERPTEQPTRLQARVDCHLAGSRLCGPCLLSRPLTVHARDRSWWRLWWRWCGTLPSRTCSAGWTPVTADRAGPSARVGGVGQRTAAPPRLLASDSSRKARKVDGTATLAPGTVSRNSGRTMGAGASAAHTGRMPQVMAVYDEHVRKQLRTEAKFALCRALIAEDTVRGRLRRRTRHRRRDGFLQRRATLAVWSCPVF